MNEEKYTEETATYEVISSSENPDHVVIPEDVNPYFGDSEEELEKAYNLASNLAHAHDGKDYRVLFKVENLETGETEEYVENTINICSKLY